MHIYVFSVKYRNLIKSYDWEFVNKIIKANTINDAINELYKQLKDSFGKETNYYIESIFKE